MIKLSCIVISHQCVMYKRMRMWKGGPNIDFKTEWQNQKLTFIWLFAAKTHVLTDKEQTMGHNNSSNPNQSEGLSTQMK